MTTEKDEESSNLTIFVTPEEGSTYEGGLFQFTANFNHRISHSSHIRCETKIYHPQIDANGCLSSKLQKALLNYR